MPHDAIAVVDFGGQYAHLIATKVRRHGVLAEIRQPDDPIEAFRRYRGIILSGSPSLSSHGEDSDYTKAIYDLPVPILGFCFGHQEIAKHYGGKVEHGGREWGQADLHLAGEHPLFAGLAPVQQVWMSHYDSVIAVGPTFRELGSQPERGRRPRPPLRGHRLGRAAPLRLPVPPRGRRHGPRRRHDPATSSSGSAAAGPPGRWSASSRRRSRGCGRRSATARSSSSPRAASTPPSPPCCSARPSAPSASTCCTSTTASCARTRAGRCSTLFERLRVSAATSTSSTPRDDFLPALDGRGRAREEAPDHRRHLRRGLPARGAAARASRSHLLGQGTIYPDTIETGGTKRADTIKTHHNRVPVIEEMIAEGRVVEPLAELYKVEVRELGERLGHPPRHGLAPPLPRARASASGCSAATGRPDRTGFDEIEPASPRSPAGSASRACVLPIRSVGVKADLRAYEHPVLLSGEVAWERLHRGDRGG